MAGRKPKVQFRVDDETYEHLLELAADAKERGAVDVTPDSMARALMQSAMGHKAHMQLAATVLLQAHKLRKRVDSMVADLIDANIPAIIKRAVKGGE